MTLHPEQSYQHTLREISVNRSNPCELVRELISNSYDAGATQIHVFPLVQKRGLIFFDNGVGLSDNKKDSINGITPYVAFFSIGKGTKFPGKQIGYKCQGSKLCFASSRFSLITRCKGEPHFRWRRIDNPKQNLDVTFDITAEKTNEPWRILRESILSGADARTVEILDVLNEAFFKTQFEHGTLIIIDEYETDKYENYFSLKPKEANYLYNYIRAFTAHGDVRRIDKEHGFDPTDVKTLSVLPGVNRNTTLRLWMTNKRHTALEAIPGGFPYLLATTDKTESQSPATVSQLRKGSFSARHATTFKYGDQYYSLILAIDGNRRALDGYDALGRRGNSRSGLALSEIRGPLIASNGIAVGPYRTLFDHSVLRDWNVLSEGQEHYALILDGNFELVTNRDDLAPSSKAVLQDADFIKHIRDFLEDIVRMKRGAVLLELRERLNRETTRHAEDQYIEHNNILRRELPERDSFVIKNIPLLAERRIFAPQRGEEHFVGALYTLLAHLVPPDHPLARYWIRPLTFSALGIDAIAAVNENKRLVNGNLQSIEYKYAFSDRDEFNHPLNVTDRIICWDLDIPDIGSEVQDRYNYACSVQSEISHEEQTLGLMLGDVHHRFETKAIAHEIMVLDLSALVKATFDINYRSGSKAKVHGKAKSKNRK